MLALQDLRKSYTGPDGASQPVLDVPAFAMDAGEHVALLGTSGSGKTTLLHLIAGILEPDAGQVLLDGRDLASLDEAGRDRVRATHIGYVFQTFQLLGAFSALENVLLGMTFGAGPDPTYARQLLEELDLGDQLDHRPAQLSTGQQQRVALARALANRPRLVLADEPTGNLDPVNARRAMDLLRGSCERHDSALLVVSHDRELLSGFARIVDLSELNRAALGERAVVTGRLLIVRRSLRQHALSTTITVLATALASGLVMAVFSVSAQSRAAYLSAPLGFDAVLGARSSPVDLVLNSVFHLETSPGNIPWSLYTGMRDDPRVELAIPYAVGDSYRGYRIVGTTDELFTADVLGARGALPLARGRAFDPAAREAVLGATVARTTGLGYGDELHPTHGLIERHGSSHDGEHDEEYLIVGVLAPTNSPLDRVVWIPLEGVYRMGGHVLRGAGSVYAPEPGVPIPDEHKEVSAVMLAVAGPQAGAALDSQVNRLGKDATLAWPIGRHVADLFDQLGWVARVLELVAYLVVVVASGAILASLYNTMNERRREFAILRALGARRSTVRGLIVAEATLIAALGGVLGYLVHLAILATASLVIRQQSGVVLELFSWHPVLIATPVGITLLGALAGWVPARKAYATDVAAGLAPGGA